MISQLLCIVSLKEYFNTILVLNCAILALKDKELCQYVHVCVFTPVSHHSRYVDLQ